VVPVVVVIVRTPAGAPEADSCIFGPGSGGATYAITPSQAQNAAVIAAVALRMGLPDHAVTIALATAFQESKLENVPYGDRDSLGLFQQRPSEGWGTSAQIMDPDYAASAFYGRLAAVEGWQAMAVTDAAQLVQHSAAPDAYATWEAEARALAEALTGEVDAGITCRLEAFAGAPPASTALPQAAAVEMGSDLIGTPLSAKVGWQVASWAVAHAYNYHLGSVSFAGRRWTALSGTWATVGGLDASSDVVTLSYETG